MQLRARACGTNLEPDGEATKDYDYTSWTIASARSLTNLPYTGTLRSTTGRCRGGLPHERDDQEEWAEQWLADIATLYRLNDERLEVRDEPVQYAAADAALRAGVQAMQERRERELAQQPKLPDARARRCCVACATTGRG